MKKWYILFTNYENSLATMKRLITANLPKGCGAYIPITVTGNKYHKTRTYTKPLYPFYLFICCKEESQLGILLKKMVPLNIEGYFLQNSDGTYATLSSDQIRHMETSLSQVQDMTNPEFTPGQSVNIVSGPMKGMKGLVTALSNEYVFVSMSTNKGKFIELPVLAADLEKL